MGVKLTLRNVNCIILATSHLQMPQIDSSLHQSSSAKGQTSCESCNWMRLLSRHGIGEHQMPSYVYICKYIFRSCCYFSLGFLTSQFSRKSAVVQCTAPSVLRNPVFFCCMDWLMDLVFHQSRVAIAKPPRSYQKSNLQHVDGASEFGLEDSISTTFDHPEGSCRYCIRKSVLSGWAKNCLLPCFSFDKHLRNLQLPRISKNLSPTPAAYLGVMQAYAQFLGCWVECALLVGCSRLMGCNSCCMFGNVFVHLYPGWLNMLELGTHTSDVVFSTRTAAN